MSVFLKIHEFEAEVVFLTTAEGGRINPPLTGYRPDHNFGLDTLNCAQHEYPENTLVEFGKPVLTKMRLLAPEFQSNRLYIGFKFTVQEGGRIVGNGTITKIIDETLVLKNIAE